MNVPQNTRIARPRLTIIGRFSSFTPGLEGDRTSIHQLFIETFDVCCSDPFCSELAWEHKVFCRCVLPATQCRVGGKRSRSSAPPGTTAFVQRSETNWVSSSIYNCLAKAIGQLCLRRRNWGRAPLP